jgi:hypothetical protein
VINDKRWMKQAERVLREVIAWDERFGLTREERPVVEAAFALLAEAGGLPRDKHNIYPDGWCNDLDCARCFARAEQALADEVLDG